MMLSEINESDSSPKRKVSDDNRRDEIESARLSMEEEKAPAFDVVPYQTLAMTTNIEMGPKIQSDTPSPNQGQH